MRTALVQVRRLTAKSYLGRYLTPEEWKLVSSNFGTKVGERFPVLPVLQLLKQEQYNTRKSRKPWLSEDGFEKSSFIRSLLSDEDCLLHRTEWYLTIRSLYDYLIVHSEQPKRVIFESFINAAFEAKRWQEAVECFETLQNSSVAVSDQDILLFKAAISYGKLGRYGKMKELLPTKWLYHGCAIQLTLNPIESGAELAQLHSQMLELLLSGNCGEILSATRVLDDLFVCAMLLLEEQNVTAVHFIKALELLMFRTKLHSSLTIFYHCNEHLVLRALEDCGFMYKEIRTGAEDEMCTNDVCRDRFLPQINFTSAEVTDLRHLFLQYMLDEAKLKSKNDLATLEEQLHDLHKVIHEKQVDVVIDGMNAAFRNAAKSLHLDLGQIVFTKIQQLVENVKTPNVLVLLPGRKALLEHSRFRFNELKKAIHLHYPNNVVLHTVHPSILDDKFIIYAALFANSFILTNDFYRDHVAEVVKINPAALSLGSFLVSRRIDSYGLVTAKNIRNRNAVKVEPPTMSSFVSQFSVTPSDSEANCFHLRLHEPLKIDAPHGRPKNQGPWQPYNWVCAKKTFFSSHCDAKKINNWINANIR